MVSSTGPVAAPGPSLDSPVGQTRFAAIDFESAGCAPGATDVPVQVGIAVWTPGRPLAEADRFVSYIASDRPVTWAAQRVHGISTSDLAGAPAPVALWPDLKRHLAGAAVVAHGAGTERRFLRAFPYHGFAPWIDTLKLARRSLPGLGDYSLGALCEAAGLTASIRALCPGRGWHDALFDAVASVAFLEFLIEGTGVRDQPLAALADV